MRHTLGFIRNLYRTCVTNYPSQTRAHSIIPSLLSRLRVVVPDAVFYGGTFVASVVGWYKYCEYKALRTPPEQHPLLSPLQFDCTVVARELSQCDLPPPELLARAGARFGFDLHQAAWAASHLCPIEFHVVLAEQLLREIWLKARCLFSGALPRLKNVSSAAAAAGLLEQAYSDAVTEMKKCFDSAAIFDHVPLEEALSEFVKRAAAQTSLPAPPAALSGAASAEARSEAVYERVPSVFAAHAAATAPSEPLAGTLPRREHSPAAAADAGGERGALADPAVVASLFVDILRSKIYEYLVANWEAARYFDAHTYREGYFGPRKTHMAEGIDTGMRGASWLLLDKPELRTDAYPANAEAVRALREACAAWEKRTDRSYLNFPSKERLQRTREALSWGGYTHDTKAQFDWLKARATRSLMQMSRDQVLGSADKNVVFPHGIDVRETFVSPDDFCARGLDFASLKKATESLRRYGFVRIKRAFTPETVAHVKRQLFINDFAARDFGDKVVQTDGNVHVQRLSFARVTAFLRGSSYEPYMVELQRPWLPLVHALMPTEEFFGARALEQLRQNGGGRIFDWAREWKDPDFDPDRPDLAAEAPVDAAPTHRLFAGAMHAVCQDVNAPEEGFVIDNPHPSISVIVALDEMKSGRHGTGGPQVVPGSHHFGSTGRGLTWRHFWQRDWSGLVHAMLRSGGTANIYLAPGDVLVLDSRVYRRNHGVAPGRTSSYLIFHYDYPFAPAASQTGLQPFVTKAKSAVLYWAGLVTRLAYAKADAKRERRRLREVAAGMRPPNDDGEPRQEENGRAPAPVADLAAAAGRAS